MEVTAARPTNEAIQLQAASLQTVRFKERRLRDAQSDVRNDAVYFSPVIRIDQETQTAILQYRNSETGQVEREYPAPPKKGAYQDVPQQASVEVVPAPVKAEQPNDTEKAGEKKEAAEHIDENA